MKGRGGSQAAKPQGEKPTQRKGNKKRGKGKAKQRREKDTRKTHGGTTKGSRRPSVHREGRDVRPQCSHNRTNRAMAAEIERSMDSQPDENETQSALTFLKSIKVKTAPGPKKARRMVETFYDNAEGYLKAVYFISFPPAMANLEDIRKVFQLLSKELHQEDKQSASEKNAT